MAERRDEFFRYVPVNDDAFRWGLAVTGGGRRTLAAGSPYPPPGHPELYQFHWQRGRTLPEFQLILITAGRGRFESEDCGSAVIEPDTLFWLFPGHWHRYRPDPETGWTERWVSLNGEICHRLVDLEVLAPSRALSAVSPERIAALTAHFDAMLDRIGADVTPQPIVLSLWCMGLLAEAIEAGGSSSDELERWASGRGRPVKDALVEAAQDVIWTHSHRQLRVEQIARQVPATRRTLERRFRRVRGHSLLDEIRLCRIVRAQRLLSETRLPIKTVAYLAGFRDAQDMRAVFRRVLGQSPTRFRAGSREV